MGLSFIKVQGSAKGWLIRFVNTASLLDEGLEFKHPGHYCLADNVMLYVWIYLRFRESCERFKIQV